MGREAAGVRGIKLGEGQELIALIVVGEGNILTASENGYGKLTPLDDFPAHGRGGQGVIALQTTERNGATVAGLQVTPGQEIMLISSTGTLVRTAWMRYPSSGRNTQGVRLIRLAEGERLTASSGSTRLLRVRMSVKAGWRIPRRRRMKVPRNNPLQGSRYSALGGLSETGLFSDSPGRDIARLCRPGAVTIDVADKSTQCASSIFRRDRLCCRSKSSSRRAASSPTGVGPACP